MYPVKQALEQLLSEALARLTGTLLPTAVDPKLVVIERTRDATNGDFATNVAMRFVHGGLAVVTMLSLIVSFETVKLLFE